MELQTAINLRTFHHFDQKVVNIAIDFRLVGQLNWLWGIDITIYGSINDDGGDFDLTFNNARSFSGLNL